MAASLPRAFGPYLLLARLGRGGSGAAYIARHRDELHRASVQAVPIVVKCLHLRLARHDEFTKRFRHEAEVAIRVSSPHVVRVLDAGRVGEQPYIAMDYVRGWTLSRINACMAETEVRMAVPLALELILQSLQGLVALHEATDSTGQPLETVHRDLAPKNLMVGDEGRVRLIDLGLGKSRVQDWKTDTGTVMGSPGYMAPEQLAGRSVDQRTDLYALGVVLHELLTGERYVPHGPPIDMLRTAMNRKYAPPSAVRRDVPPAVDAIVERAMRKKPDDRYPTARAFIDDVQAELPRRPGSAAVQRLVEELLGQQRRARDEEIERLLGLSDPADSTTEPGTEVYVRSPHAPTPGPDAMPTKALDTTDQRTVPTQSWSPGPPLSSVPMAGGHSSSSQRAVFVAAAVGFGAGIVVMLALYYSTVDPRPAPVEPPVMGRTTAPSRVGSSGRTPAAQPSASARSPSAASRNDDGTPVVDAAATSSRKRRKSSTTPRTSSGTLGRAPKTAGERTSRRAKTSSARPPSLPKTTSERTRRSSTAVVRPARGLTVAERSDRLQKRITAATKALGPDDPRRQELLRLQGRLSLIQTADAAQAERQLAELERRLAAVSSR